LKTSAGAELCVVRNISSGGLRAQIFSDLKIGSPAVVELKTGLRMCGKLIWAQDQHVGLQFHLPIKIRDVLASATAAAEGKKSRLPRIEIRRFATVRQGARLFRGSSIDISQGGLKVAVNGPLQRGPVVVALTGLYPVEGSVRWSDENQAGIEFHSLVSLSRLIDWAKQEVRPLA
jgi:hypothetical protein